MKQRVLFKKAINATRQKILTKIYNLPWVLGEVVNDSVKISIDGNKETLFRASFYVNNRFLYKLTLENGEGEKVILKFEIIPMLYEGYEVCVSASATTRKLSRILDYIESKLEELFAEEEDLSFFLEWR